MASSDEREVAEVELLSKQPNASVIRLPWRKFPGVVVQGDSLSILVDLAEDVRAALVNSTDEEVAGAAGELHSKLAGLLAHYEHVLGEAGIALPYVRSK